MDEKLIEDIIDNSKITLSKEDIIVKLSEIILGLKNQNNDLLLLSKNIGLENTLKISKLFSKKKIKFPDYDKVQHTLILALVYYYKELYIDMNKGKTGLSWNETEAKIGKNLNLYKNNYYTVRDKINNFLKFKGN